MKTHGKGSEERGFNAGQIIARMREEYWKSVESPPPEEPDDITSLLVFTVAKEGFALEVTSVREVTLVPTLVARVPRGADYFFGVMNLRGQILPVLDFKGVLGAPKTAPGKSSRVVVARGAVADIGLLADEVLGIRNVSRSEMTSPSQTETRIPVSIQKAQVPLEGRVVVLLDGKALATLEGVV